MNIKAGDIIRCDNEKEWIEIQYYLFNLGINWRSGQGILPFQGINTCYIYINENKNKLQLSYSDIKWYNENHDDSRTYEAKIFFRQSKIKDILDY